MMLYFILRLKRFFFSSNQEKQKKRMKSENRALYLKISCMYIIGVFYHYDWGSFFLLIRIQEIQQTKENKYVRGLCEDNPVYT
jgi:hypothetical protein